CLTYQSVLSSDVLATITSLRMPSTSCAYQSGKVSLSPTVTRMPYGSTLLSRSCAKSRVSVCPARDAAVQFATNGTNATRSNGDTPSHPLRVGSVSYALPSFTPSLPTSEPR